LPGPSVDISRGEPLSGWNEFLYSAGREAGLCQSIYWARVLGKIEGAEPLFIRASLGGKAAAQALVLKKYPYDRVRARRRFPLPFLECIDGPAILQQTDARAALEAILAEVHGLAKKSHATHITFSPSRASGLRQDGALAEVYGSSGYAKKGWATFLVDLTPSEEELFKGLAHAARKCVKKCKRAGVATARMNSFKEFRDVYWAAYALSERHFGREAKPCFREAWDEDTEGYYHHWVAKDDKGSVLGCLGMHVFNGVATEIASSISPEAFERKIPAQDILHWEMMLEAKRLGCHTFDLAGVSPEPETPKEEGIRRFKKKWGGDYVEYDTFVREMTPRLNRLRARLGSLGRSVRDRLPKRKPRP
jgi:lipid II:glycine glycyltransferase (peptidoglycan interpeptide bridge formation enzyme)